MISFQQYLLIFIMQQVIEKSLKVTVLKEISQLNRANAEFCAILRKLNSTQHQLNQAFSQKLDIMRTDIKEKIRQLSSNVDLMYQIFDRKIALLIRKIQANPINSQLYEQQLRIRTSRVKQLQQQLNNLKGRQHAIITQNQHLKNKNIALIEELESMSKRKANTVTNDSSRNILKTQITQDHSNQQTPFSPIQQPIMKQKFGNNDLTFNNSQRELSTNRKQIKSEQNSFSSLLIKEQNSFQVSFGSDKKEKGQFQFGCMPIRENQQKSINFRNSPSKRKNQNNEQQKDKSIPDQNHRMFFLLNNLKQSHQQSFNSQSSRHHYTHRDQSAGKSVLSNVVVKKYHI